MASCYELWTIEGVQPPIMIQKSQSNMSKAIEWIQQHAEQMSDDLETLCNINSGSENMSGLQVAAEWLTGFFSPLGVDVDRIELPTFHALNDSGIVVERSTGPALRWDLGQRKEKGEGANACISPRLLMTIHYDTVYEASDPFQICTRLDGHRMRGPGVIDAKGGIVVMRYAALAAKQFLDLSRSQLTVVLTPDEEIGSPSSTHLWKRIANEFDFALLFEPSMADGSLVGSRKGTGTYTFIVHGRAAHSGRNFAAGRNALVHASRMIVDLHGLNGQRPDVTINVGRIRGGGAVNVVPDLAVFRVNVRVKSLEDQEWVATQVSRIAELHQRPDEGLRVTVEGGIQSPPKVVDATIQNWMSRIESAASSLEQSIQWKESGGASDGNKLQALGLANIDTLGPDGDALHSDQEWVDLASLPRKASLVFRILEQAISESTWHSTASRTMQSSGTV